MDPIAARALLQRYLEGDASEDEIVMIELWHRQLVDAGEWSWSEGEKEQMEAALEQRLLRSIGKVPAEGAGRAPRILPWRKISVAAALLLVIVAGWLIYSRRSPSIASVGQRYSNEVMPGRNAAVLTLAEGRTVVLGDSAPHRIGQQGGMDIVNDNGQLAYQPSGQPVEMLFNTLTTQRGNQYHLVLPDGTKVWLNAASSITYPVYFTGKERKVVVSGEAYFEVAKNELLPFIVQQGEMTVRVLGTSFDVNGYSDEGSLKATLLEGKIRVGKGAGGSVLIPGQQAVIRRNDGRISVVKDPDIDKVIAWKNGTFAFNDTDIESIMRQVERWYDVQIVYEGKINRHFVADVPRNIPLSQLLQLLEATGQVHFRIEGRKVIVLP